MYISFKAAYMYVYCVWLLSALLARRGCQILWNWGHRGSEYPCCFQELKSEPLQEQQILLSTKPSLGPRTVLHLSVALHMSFQQVSFSEDESEELIEFACQVLRNTGNSQLLKIENQRCENSNVALQCPTSSICRLGFTVLKSHIDEMCMSTQLLLYSLQFHALFQFSVVLFHRHRGLVVQLTWQSIFQQARSLSQKSSIK